MQKTPIRVVLADDHQMVRAALASILEESGEISVVHQTSDPGEVIERVVELAPDVVVLDYSMPQHDAPELIQRLLETRPTQKILVLTVHENIHYAVRALEAGARGYLIKSAAVQELLEAIRALQAGRTYLSAAISDEVLLHLRQPRRQRIGVEALSPREFDFLRLLGQGKSLNECAREMHITTSTASTYRSRIMEKLSLRGTAELIRFALEQDIVG